MTLNSAYTKWDVGLRGRIRTGSAKAPLIGLMAGAGGVIFATTNVPANLQGGVPDVNLVFFRASLDLRIPIDRAFIVLGGGYKRPFGENAVYSRFKGATTNGIDVLAGVGVRVVNGLDVRLMANYDRFFSSFTPKVGDAYVAGGALDQYLGLDARAWRMYS